jgi:hypothetical protein
MLTHSEFVALKRHDIVRSATGKTYRVVVSEPNALEPSGHYVHVERCNADGSTEGLTARERAASVSIRQASKSWTQV